MKDLINRQNAVDMLVDTAFRHPLCKVTIKRANAAFAFAYTNCLGLGLDPTIDLFTPMYLHPVLVARDTFCLANKEYSRLHEPFTPETLIKAEQAMASWAFEKARTRQYPMLGDVAETIFLDYEKRSRLEKTF